MNMFPCHSMLPQDWDLLRMWDSLVLEETQGNSQEWNLSHEGTIPEESSKALLCPAKSFSGFAYTYFLYMVHGPHYYLTLIKVIYGLN